MNLNERIPQITEFHPDRTIGSVHDFFLPSEGASFDRLHAEAKGRGFTEDYGGEFFSVRWFGENGKKMSWSPLFHE